VRWKYFKMVEIDLKGREHWQVALYDHAHPENREIQYRGWCGWRNMGEKLKSEKLLVVS
jgi:hypothetical protein